MLDFILDEIQFWFFSLLSYLKAKVVASAHLIEANKRRVVAQLLWRRGALYRPFVHASVIALALIVVFAGGVIPGTNVVGSAYPGIEDARVLGASTDEALTLPLDELLSSTTNISEKPRAEILEYTVESGDTLSSIAEKFGIDVQTIRWANDVPGDIVRPGDVLDILPVTGVAHTVTRGDTIYGIAKTYDINAQAILDFPFNDVGDDLALQVGTVLIVPGGVPPGARAAPRQRQFVAQGQEPVTGGGIFRWPVGGEITQYFAWYHRGLDIANKSAPGIAAADGGRVIVAGWPDASGYGNRVIIDHGNGYQTLYAHLSRIYVSIGDYVNAGDVIGQMGSTGRSTGTHLHFEIRQNGTPVDPLSILQ